MDEALQREQARKRKQKQRDRDRAKSVTLESVTPESVTSYRPIIIALADPIKRAKLKAVCQSLGRHNVLDTATYYGCGKDPTLMSEVSELLTAFD